LRRYIKIYVNIYGPSARVEILHGSLNLLVKSISENIYPRFLGSVFVGDYWRSAHGTSIGSLIPIINTSPMERVVAVKRVFCSPYRLQANWAFWKLIIGSVMDTIVVRAWFHLTAWV